MASICIQFKNVSFRYAEDQDWIIKNCTFDIYHDEWVAIIGHNGSGKSTIAKLLIGLYFPQEGEITINGRPVTPENVWEIRKDVGLVFQNPDNQFVGTTVQDDVAFGMENRGFSRKEMIERIQKVLEIVQMEKYLLTEPHRLSGGQKQRIAIASVLAIAPQVMILDEATTMLDPIGRLEIMQTISNIQQDHRLSLLTITHDLNEIVQADRVIVLNEGEIWAETTPRELFSNGKALRDIGLDTPFAISLFESLTSVGVPLKRYPLDQRELLEDLWTLHSKM